MENSPMAEMLHEFHYEVPSRAVYLVFPDDETAFNFRAWLTHGNAWSTFREWTTEAIYGPGL